MSQNVLIGKVRKTGKWVLIVDPGETYDVHLRAYQKISSSQPVSDEYSKVILARTQNTSTPLTLITGEEKKQRDESLKNSVAQAANAGKDADERQARIAKEELESRLEEHGSLIDDKNALINKIRKATGQQPLSTTKRETADEVLAERLTKEADERKAKAKPAEKPDEAKAKAELLAEKNRVITDTKAQAAAIISEKTK